MALTLYCEPNEARAALGANSIELPDAVLNLPIYLIGLMRELNKVSPSLPGLFAPIVGKKAEDRAPLEAALHDAVRLFSVYSVAKQVGVSLASMLPKAVGDGKASTSRFADAPYKETMSNVETMFHTARSGLVETLEAYNQTGTAKAVRPITAFLAAPRAYDPITG